MAVVLHVPAFNDNYIWLVRGRTDRVAIVDPGDADPVLEFLARERLTPDAILCTHHHGDHVGGVEDLRARYDVPVYGPRHERIAALTHRLGEGDRVALPNLGIALTVLDIPGHTAGHIAYVGDGLLFCGDTLFSAGCGRLFEGTAEQMHASLGKLAALPDDTAVYCGHEYTQANLEFARAVEPENSAARAYRSEVALRRGQGGISLPSTIGRERQINPFLRCHLPDVRAAAEKHAGKTLPTDVEVFAALRRWKDSFRS